MIPVDFRQKALSQIEAQIAYFDLDAGHVSEPFKDDLRDLILLLQTFPNLGCIGEVSGTREIISPKFKYIIVYRFLNDRLEILRIYFRGQTR